MSANEFSISLSKVDTFLQTLSKESLSLVAEKQRKVCIKHVQEMMSAIQNTRRNGNNNLLAVGLSHSTQELYNATAAVAHISNDLKRSDSLPEVSNGSIQGVNSDLQQDVNLNDFRQLILYDPIEEEGEDETDSDTDDDKLKLSANNVKDVCMSPKRSRKRDSAALFDITLDDLGEPDFAGFLTEKHSGQQWWCVLQDMHLCMFPSRDPDEVAYDVIIMPCCQISLDDRLLRTPVFRLMQSGMPPWVLMAKDTRELKEWMNVLTVATTGGSFAATNKPPEKPTSKVAVKPQMFSIEEEEDAGEEIPDQPNKTPSSSSSAGQLCSNSNKCHPWEDDKQAKNEDEEAHRSPTAKVMTLEGPAVRLTSHSDQEFGEDLYEPVVPLKGGDEYEDDGFATDEFDSGSSDGEVGNSNAPSSPRQTRKAKKKRFFKWLRKKSKRYKLFSSPEEGVTLAGYALRHENNSCSKRWFLIREGKLYCYKSIKEEEPEAIVPLDGTEIKVGDEDRSKMVVKVVQDGVVKFILATKSQKDLERWKTALKMESGFIKHGSPTSSGIYDDEEEGDYILPVCSASSTHDSFLSSSPPGEAVDGLNDNLDEDLYMEVVPMSTSPSMPHSTSMEGLGPLPAIPPDLPTRAEKVEEVESGQESDDYEEVCASLPHADKVNQWQERGRKQLSDEDEDEDEELYVDDIRDKRAEKGDEASKEDKKASGNDTEQSKAKGPVPVGVEDGTILDAAMTASSCAENSKPAHGRLNAQACEKHAGAWCPKTNDKAQFLQIDLADTVKVCAVATQGRANSVQDGGWFVKTYTLAYSKDGDNWVNYKEFGIAKVFQGNADPEGVVTNQLKRPVNARYVRIKPQAWNTHIAMRVEVYKGEASSKLEAGIHKLAATLTKAGKGKTFDKQVTSPTELAPADKGLYEDLSPTHEKTTLARQVSFDENVEVIAEQSEKTEATKSDENGRKASREELEVEAKVQQKIEESKRVNGSLKQTIPRTDASSVIQARRSLYENGGTSNEEKRSEKKVVKTSVTLGRKPQNKETTKISEPVKEGHGEVKSEKTAVSDNDRESEILEKTEQAFQNFAKKLKSDDTTEKKVKRTSVVALQKMNFENPRSDNQSKTPTPGKCQELLREKAEVTAKLEALKRRVTIAKDRKVFFGRSDGRNAAAATAAEKELQSAQAELSKTKERLQAIESEAKNAKVLELRYQKSVDNSSKKPAPLLRRNSREVKIGATDKPGPKVDAAAFNPGGQKAQRGSVLSQIKAFEKLKE